MRLLRIEKAEALPGLRLRLTLTDGSVIERDIAPLLNGPVFERIRSDPTEFARVRVEGGTVVGRMEPICAPTCSHRLSGWIRMGRALSSRGYCV